MVAWNQREIWSVFFGLFGRNWKTIVRTALFSFPMTNSSTLRAPSCWKWCQGHLLRFQTSHPRNQSLGGLWTIWQVAWQTSWNSIFSNRVLKRYRIAISFCQCHTSRSQIWPPQILCAEILERGLRQRSFRYWRAQRRWRRSVFFFGAWCRRPLRRKVRGIGFTLAFGDLN